MEKEICKKCKNNAGYSWTPECDSQWDDCGRVFCHMFEAETRHRVIRGRFWEVSLAPPEGCIYEMEHLVCQDERTLRGDETYAEFMDYKEGTPMDVIEKFAKLADLEEHDNQQE